MILWQLKSRDIILIVYFVVMNIITFTLFAVDKKRAIQKKWRIKEATLLGFSLFGGALLGLVAMHSLRHKTKKKYFTISLPIMLIVHIAIMVLLYIYIF